MILDLGFGDIVSYPPSSHPGIVVIRVARASATNVSRVMGELFASTAVEQLRGAITIGEAGRVRLRR